MRSVLLVPSVAALDNAAITEVLHAAGGAPIGLVGVGGALLVGRLRRRPRRSGNKRRKGSRNGDRGAIFRRVQGYSPQRTLEARPANRALRPVSFYPSP